FPCSSGVSLVCCPQLLCSTLHVFPWIVKRATHCWGSVSWHKDPGLPDAYARWGAELETCAPRLLPQRERAACRRVVGAQHAAPSAGDRIAGGTHIAAEGRARPTRCHDDQVPAAGMPNRSASANSGPIFAAPSSIEYSV